MRLRVGFTDRIRAHRPGWPGLAAAAVVVAAAGLLLAVTWTPYRWDEAAHTGYVMSLRDGTLPDIDTRIPGEGRSRELEVAAGRSGGFFNPDVHVANNPPHVYALTIPAAELSLRSGVRAGPLLGVRAVDVAGGVAAVVFTYLLAWELTRRRLTALTAAALQATLVAVPIVTSHAGLDGPGLAAAGAVAWALARVLRRGGPGEALGLGVACAVGASIRPMSLAFAAVAGAIGLVHLWRRHGTGALPGLAVRVGAPAVVVAGWWYVLNVVRYGDPTGSQALFEKFDMRPREDFWSFLLSSRSFTGPLGYVVRDVYGVSTWFEPTAAARRAGVAAVVVLVAVIAASVRRAPWREAVARRADLAPPGAWAALVLLAGAPAVFLTQHWVGGGGAHPRYLFPVLPILCSAAAVLLAAVHRLLPALAVAVLGVELLRRLDGLVDDVVDVVATRSGVLSTRLLGGPVPTVLLACTGIAVALLVAALVMAARDEEDPAPPPRPVGRVTSGTPARQEAAHR